MSAPVAVRGSVLDANGKPRPFVIHEDGTWIAPRAVADQVTTMAEGFCQTSPSGECETCGRLTQHRSVVRCSRHAA